MIALSGTVNDGLLNALLDHPFFKEKAPKTTGPELFNLSYLEDAQQVSGTKEIDPEDIISTLSAFTARTLRILFQQQSACRQPDICERRRRKKSVCGQLPETPVAESHHRRYRQFRH